VIYEYFMYVGWCSLDFFSFNVNFDYSALSVAITTWTCSRVTGATAPSALAVPFQHLPPYIFCASIICAMCPSWQQCLPSLFLALFPPRLGLGQHLMAPHFNTINDEQDCASWCIRLIAAISRSSIIVHRYIDHMHAYHTYHTYDHTTMSLKHSFLSIFYHNMQSIDEHFKEII